MFYIEAEQWKGFNNKITETTILKKGNLTNKGSIGTVNSSCRNFVVFPGACYGFCQHNGVCNLLLHTVV